MYDKVRLRCAFCSFGFSFIRVRVRVRVNMFFDTNSIRGSNSVDDVCDFESVPPDNSAQALKRD